MAGASNQLNHKCAMHGRLNGSGILAGMAGTWTVLLLAALAGGRVASIDFFGHGGMDLPRVRALLPLRVGDRTPLGREGEIARAIGHGARVSAVCCDERGDYYVFIGLAGTTAREIRFHPVPSGSARLPGQGLELYGRLMELLAEAVRKGVAREDRSRGYALNDYAPMKATQLEMRAYALRHPRELREVLASAADARQRMAAAQLLGYAEESDEQIAALAAAAHDADETVRNNATRALGVLAERDPATARKIPAAPFIDLLKSTTWTDRNKALMVLVPVTEARDPATLRLLRREAFDALQEMADWSSSYREPARLVLERIGAVE